MFIKVTRRVLGAPGETILVNIATILTVQEVGGYAILVLGGDDDYIECEESFFDIVLALRLFALVADAQHDGPSAEYLGDA